VTVSSEIAYKTVQIVKITCVVAIAIYIVAIYIAMDTCTSHVSGLAALTFES